jgi:hypothetical protein
MKLPRTGRGGREQNEWRKAAAQISDGAHERT